MALGELAFEQYLTLFRGGILSPHSKVYYYYFDEEFLLLFIYLFVDFIIFLFIVYFKSLLEWSNQLVKDLFELVD